MSSDPDKTRKWHPLPKSVRSLAGISRSSVLLETAKQSTEQDKSFLFLNPTEELIAHSPGDLDSMFEKMESYAEKGAYLAGFFSYECGEHFLGFKSQRRERSMPAVALAWFGVYTEPIIFDHTAGVLAGATLSEPGPYREAGETKIHSEGLKIAYPQYAAKIEQIKEYLQAGDTYQVNFTDCITGSAEGEPVTIYENLLMKQPVPYAAFLNLQNTALLSFSPELFFRLSNRQIIVKPMKGTWPRGMDVDEDREAAAELAEDAKNRSEHVMIVDLLRNDLGRICEAGSVQVDELFSVERYRTLLQMTSTISGVVRPEITTFQVFKSLFPSGSITGAPKHRTMEIIQELESSERGPYTGAIGYFAPNGDACFNVAIRTLALTEGTFSLGVGGGITADSQPEAEYEECKLKGAFLTRALPEFSLIETMRSIDGVIPLLALHLERLKRSSAFFDYAFDLDELERKISLAACEGDGSECRVRLEMNAAGIAIIAVSPLLSAEWNGKLLIARATTASKDLFLRHKTTNRVSYENCFADARSLGFDEVLFFNDQNELTEGAISNIFLQRDGQWLTPSLDCGVLPGVQRAVLLKELPNVQESHLSLEDLKAADAIFLCNALRGIRQVRSVELPSGEVIWKAQENALSEAY